MSSHQHRLLGQRPEPLGSYLAALGIFRLLAEQEDPSATAWWEGDVLVLGTDMPDDELERFFLKGYRPTPVLSPWNSSSGFGPPGKDDEVMQIEGTADDRLGAYRTAASVARQLLDKQQQMGWSKEDLIRACRAKLPDDCLPWLDAAAVLTPDGLAWPPLLGTGGNIGRFEVSRNFMRHVLVVLGATRKRGYDRAAWLRQSLWAIGAPPALKGESASQFDAGAAGGANSAPEGEGKAVLNPWDFVFLVEGSMLFAAGSSRRLAFGARGLAAAPFTADTVSTGYPSASEAEETRGELWAPIWDRPTPLGELQRLFAEGRAQWRRHQARSGLELAKAAGSLGVDRGIAAFARHVFAKRNGRVEVAVGAGRVSVGDRPQVPPLAQLDRWLEGLRRAARSGEAPAAVRARLRQVDDAAFQVAAGRVGVLPRLLVEVAVLEDTLGKAGAFRDKSGVLPVRGLRAGDWAPLLLGELEGPEMRLALCLSSLRDIDEGTGRPTTALRCLLRPIGYDRRGRAEWREPAEVAGLGARPIIAVLAEAHRRRAVDLLAARRSSSDTSSPEGPGLQTSFRFGLSAHLDDLDSLVSERLDEELLGQLLAGCLLLDWRGTPGRLAGLLSPHGRDGHHPALATLGPFYARQPRLNGEAGGPASGERRGENAWTHKLASATLTPEAGWPGLLLAGRTAEVLRSARRRLQMAELQPVADFARLASLTRLGQRLGAALLCGLSGRARVALLIQSCPPDPELEGSSQEVASGELEDLEALEQETPLPPDEYVSTDQEEVTNAQ